MAPDRYDHGDDFAYDSDSDTLTSYRGDGDYDGDGNPIDDDGD